MGLQAALLTSAALTAEVDVLKKDLERSEQELGHAKKQLEEKKVSNTSLNKYLTEKDFGCKKLTRIICALQGPLTRWQP